MIKTVGIVGAGFAGLSTAKVLKALGFQVQVFEKEPEVGGVWAVSRRYPGLTTQNVRSTYALSDFPMPASYPEWPSGEQVQAYMQGYVDKFGLGPHIALNTEVMSAVLDEEALQWTVATRDVASGAVRQYHFDQLIVCNGIFSEPAVPTYPGQDAFVAAGGRICHTSQFNHAADASGKHVLVVGYGKSSCDVANAIAPTSASTTVLARTLIWKIPKKFMNVLNYKFLLLTRMGEALFRYIELKGFEKFLHGPGKPVRDAMLGSVESVVTRQLKLREIGLHPGTPLETIARSTVSLVTDGFYEKVAAGQLKVTQANIQALQPGLATLSNGDTVPADIVVCGTGWHQQVPFLDAATMARVTDAAGNFRLYRAMLPTSVPRLAFNGYNSSFFSQLNCEIGALWLGDWLRGGLQLPPRAEQEALIDRRLAWMEERTDGKHAKGTNIIPFSVHNIDELLQDMGLQLGSLTRFKQWLGPIDPRDYQVATRRLLQRHALHKQA